MSIQVTTETTPSRASSLQWQSQPPLTSRRSWWWKRVLLVCTLGAVSVAVALLWGAMTTRETGPQLTHKIARGELIVTVSEQGLLESSHNIEIKCKVRGQSTVTWVIEGGTYVQPGDELVRLDTLAIEEAIAERSKYAHWSRSAAERSKANVTRSTLAISEYEQGRYLTQLLTLEKDLAVAKSNLRSAENWLLHATRLQEKGFTTDLEIEQRNIAVKQAELDVEVKETEIDVLQRFTREEQLRTLDGNLKATEATHEANAERAFADGSRRDRAVEELEHCVIRAETDGLVIHPSAAQWKTTPDISEGATVYQTQVLLLMPDLSKMQVRVGIHESMIDRIQTALPVRVKLTDRTIEAQVSSVASVAKPAGWWTGNAVKYDTIIELPPQDALKPGMSAEVDIMIARYEDVMLIPVAAVVETLDGSFCWVRANGDTKQRLLELGDSNGIFFMVKTGLKEGEEVVLNPTAYLSKEQSSRLQRRDKSNDETNDTIKPQKPGTDVSGSDSNAPEPDSGV
jgi:multidrug resistance efflux pump